MQSDERLISGIEHRSFRGDAVDRIRPVENHDRQIIALAGAQAEKHRPDKCVITRADILKIDEQHIEVLQHCPSWFAMLAIEAVDRNAQSRMLVTPPFDHVVLGLAEVTVLRAKERAKTPVVAIAARQDFGGMFKPSRYRGGMK